MESLRRGGPSWRDQLLPKLSRSFRLHHLLLALALAVGLFALVPGGAGAQSPGLPPVGTNFAAPGPYAVTVQNDAAHTYYSPATLGEGGVDHPIILWGNGTGTTPPVYDGLLRHFASHGFVVAAANTSNAGSGNEMLAGLDNLTAFNGQSGNRFFGHLDLGHVGATGHSQGAGGAVATARDPRIDTIFPLQGYGAPAARAGLTAVYFAGQNDTILTPTVVRGSYTGSSGIPAAYAELAGATHFVPVGNAGGFRGPATAWARWHLAGDGNGHGLFVGAGCGLCSSPEWSAYEANPRLQSLAPPIPTTTTTSTTSTSTPEPTTTTTVVPPGECVTALNSAHIQAGRATRPFLLVRAVGSGDVLGFSFQSSALRQTAPGTWDRFQGC
jgi:hypothetical protein